MEIKRLRKACSAGVCTQTKRRTCVSWLGCVVIILHITCMLCRSWYSLYLDFESCSSCGPLVVTIGRLLDKSSNRYADDINQSRFRKANYNSDDIRWLLDGMHKEQEEELVFRESLLDKQDGELTIENGVYVYIGLWTVMLCHVNGVTCAEVDHATSGLSLRSIQPFMDILDSLYDCRPFFLLGITCNTLMVVFSRIRHSVISTSKDVEKITAGLGVLSALFSLLAMVIAGMPYMTSVCHFRFMLPMVPWSFLIMVLSGYISSVIAYQLWNTRRTTPLTFRNWQAENLYKFSV